ncbi:hypothetical protein LAZ67_1003452 [Cordylochernes scorpioides]|uniref:Uncharacterized protein n=1 Tax=Cordylochernes scorpioides TaxID=51811 RepID=A0ABY6JWU9_9ARAC|nr:hypothetical protein LAZ67_1003452 [Cordylochernes scorpioides]
MFTGTLLLQFQPLKSGQRNLNVVARCSKMTHVKDGHTVNYRKVDNIVLDDRRVKQCLGLFMRDPVDFVRRFVTMDGSTTTRQTTVEAAGGSRWFSAKESEADINLNFLISWMPKFAIRGLAGERKNHLSPGQRTCLQKFVGNGKTSGFEQEQRNQASALTRHTLSQLG